MRANEKTTKNWDVVISYLEKIKPDYGTINLELIYHQGMIKRVDFTPASIQS